MKRVMAVLVISGMVAGCATDGQTPGQSVGSAESGVMRLARSAKEAGDSASAANLLRQGIASQKDNIALYIELADLYMEQNKPQAATKVLDEGIANNPKDLTLLRKLGNTYLHRDQPEKAMVTFNKILEITPNDSMALGNRGIALDMLGRTEQARKSYDAALKADKENISTLNNLAMSHILSGNYAKAIELLEPVASEDKASPQVRQNLAFAYALQGNTEKARMMGLKDLSETEVNENLEFYKSLSHLLKNGETFVPPVSMKDNAMMAPTSKSAAKAPAPITEADRARAKEDEELLANASPAAAKAPEPVALNESAGGKRWYIDLGDFNDGSAAQEKWDALRPKVNGLTDAMYGTVSQPSGKEKLIVGPFAGYDEFSGICEQLGKIKQRCNVVSLTR